MQIPILSGVYTTIDGDFRTSYPRNLIPVPKQTGVSNDYLKPADGIKLFATPNFGPDRGGINWGGVCYRVCGADFISINPDGVVVVIGQVLNDGGVVKMDYSFSRLAIVSAGKVYYYDKTTFYVVTDPDLGSNILDVVFVDGYFMFVDFGNIIVTELSDPTQIDPLKYGSAEYDADDILGIAKIANEPHIIGRNTIEPFYNTGGSDFPFQRVNGGLITKGAIGYRAHASFMDGVAVVGGGRNEPPAVWVCGNSRAVKISTREIDQILKTYTFEDLQGVYVESISKDAHRFLYIHLNDKTLCYDAAAAEATGQPIWFTLDSGNITSERYKARSFVWCYNKWICGDPTSNRVGVLTSDESNHYDGVVAWEFSTQIVYNESKNGIFHELELVALTGSTSSLKDSVVWTSYSHDGLTWSQESPRKIGNSGVRNNRISWLQQGMINKWRIQRFRGDSTAFLTISRLEAKMEGLSV